MAIPLSLDAADSADSLCLQADVVQGDTPMGEQRVTVTLEPGSSPGNPRMRVRTSTPVEEPVVTVTVRAGCDTKSTRVFALLADVPSDISVPGVFSSGQQAPSNTARGSGRASGFGAGDEGMSSSGATAGRGSDSADTNGRMRDANAAPPPPRRRVAPPPRRAVVAQAAQAPARSRTSTPPAPRPAASEPKREVVAGAPRLQLEALEPTPVMDAGLKTSPALSLPPGGEDPARRAEAAAQWRALTAAPEVSERDAQRMQTLEATLATLRQQTAQNQSTLLEMRSELAEARESRYRNPLVYALIGLLLLALLAIFMLWRLARRAAAPAWWGETPPGKEGPLIRSAPRTVPFDDDADAEPASAARRSANATTFGAASFAPLEPDEDSGFDDPLPHPPRAPDGAPVRPVNTEELFDVQQQSDFFLSLGQHDQAIAVLREHIAANPGTSALAYLDLLRIFHSLGREEDYAHLAEEFERAFNADVPAFDKFSDTGRGLEHYRSALARIESQWPAPGTLALIEELVFRKPGVHEEAFDLAAYQELLLLYSVAKEVIDPDSAPPAPVTPHSFLDTYGHDAHDQLPTVPAPVEMEAPLEPMKDGPVMPPSLYAAIDEGMERDTVLVPEAPVTAPGPVHGEAPHPTPAGGEMDLAEFDRTAYETIAAPMEMPKPEPAIDPNVIDFELFDPSTEAEIAPRPLNKPVKR